MFCAQFNFERTSVEYVKVVETKLSPSQLGAAVLSAVVSILSVLKPLFTQMEHRAVPTIERSLRACGFCSRTTTKKGGDATCNVEVKDGILHEHL